MLCASLCACTTADAQPPGQAVVFMYHRVGDSRYPSTNVTGEDFEAQLNQLARKHFEVWPLERIVQHLKKRMPLPERTVAITFDDAYASVYENAWPKLRQRGWPFTVFISTDAVDGGLRDFMSWEQMRKMQAAGVTFANHSRSHDHLLARKPGETKVSWKERVKEDIHDAEKRLQQELGKEANPGLLFAYPFGEYSAALAGIIHELGYSGFGQHSGALGPQSDFRALPRYPINERFSDRDEFVVKADSLPLAVEEITPWDPLLDRNNPPRLRVTLAESEADLKRLACYASGQGRLSIHWIARDERRFSVQAPEAFDSGRARYNCTAPSKSGRWYWFSQPWVIPPNAKDPNH